MVVQGRWCGPSIVGLTHARRLPLGPAAARSVTTLVVLTHTNGVHAATGVTQIYPETSEAPKGVQLQQDVREFYALCPKRGLDKSTHVASRSMIKSIVTLLKMGSYPRELSTENLETFRTRSQKGVLNQTIRLHMNFKSENLH